MRRAPARHALGVARLGLYEVDEILLRVHVYPTYMPGIGHGRCVTFGRIAGINAAGGNADEEIPSLDL